MVNFFRPTSYAMKVDPTLKYAWINIPKNASSFIQKALGDNKWNDVPDDLINSIAESPNIKKLFMILYKKILCMMIIQSISIDS